jgi:hypothetical protein
MHEEEHERRDLPAVCYVIWVIFVEVVDHLLCWLCGCPQLTSRGPAEIAARRSRTGALSARDDCKDPETFGVSRTRLWAKFN